MVFPRCGVLGDFCPDVDIPRTCIAIPEKHWLGVHICLSTLTSRKSPERKLNGPARVELLLLIARRRQGRLSGQVRIDLGGGACHVSIWVDAIGDHLLHTGCVIDVFKAAIAIQRNVHLVVGIVIPGFAGDLRRLCPRRGARDFNRMRKLQPGKFPSEEMQRRPGSTRAALPSQPHRSRPVLSSADGVNLKAGGAVGLRRRSCEKTQADGQGSNTRQGMLPHVCSSPRCAHHGALRGRTLAESRHARQISWRKVRLRRCHVSATPHQPIAVSTGAWIRDAPQRSDQSAPWSRNPRKRHREPSRQRSSRRLCHRHQPQ